MHVLLTGASGYIARHIAQQLLEAGHSVLGSVRTAAKGEAVRAALAGLPEEALGRLSFVELDLTSDAGWDAALEGVDALVHTASPFQVDARLAEDALVRPAVDGTRRALEAAARAGVPRVVLTSSLVAITHCALPPGRDVYTEADWSEPDGLAAYPKSKTLAERAAWEVAEARGLALTVINPGLVLGPPLGAAYGTSVGLVARLLAGKDPAVPDLHFMVVAVEDIAAMHVAALARPETAGRRYAGAGHEMTFPEMARVVKAAHPDRRVPTRQAPRWLIRLVALVDPQARAALPDIGRRRPVSGARAEAELGVAFRDAADTVRRTAAALVAAGA